MTWRLDEKAADPMKGTAVDFLAALTARKHLARVSGIAKGIDTLNSRKLYLWLYTAGLDVISLVSPISGPCCLPQLPPYAVHNNVLDLTEDDRPIRFVLEIFVVKAAEEFMVDGGRYVWDKDGKPLLAGIGIQMRNSERLEMRTGRTVMCALEKLGQNALRAAGIDGREAYERYVHGQGWKSFDARQEIQLSSKEAMRLVLRTKRDVAATISDKQLWKKWKTLGWRLSANAENNG